jgi:hypothetical protein
MEIVKVNGKMWFFFQQKKKNHHFFENQNFQKKKITLSSHHAKIVLNLWLCQLGCFWLGV